MLQMKARVLEGIMLFDDGLSEVLNLFLSGYLENEPGFTAETEVLTITATLYGL